MASDDALTNQTVELLQALIRNACVNDGTPESGQEVRNADLLAAYLGSAGLDVQRFEPTAGRTSLVARIEGSDPNAPSLCLMGHTDVVPVNPHGWSRDPFAGELVDGEVWGRGAVDMLNLTAAQAVVFRALADRGFRPRGDLVFFAVADEESGSAHGARWMAANEADAIRADYVLTENGGLHSGTRCVARHKRERRREGCGMEAADSTRDPRPRLHAVPDRQRPGEGGRRGPTAGRLQAAAPLPRALAGPGRIDGPA